MSRVNDLSGQQFGYLTALSIESRGPVKWLCKCVCGKTIVRPASYLVSGETKSCGCKKGEMCQAPRRTHGASGTKVYDVWCKMISRCENFADKDFPNYGGRGILVCGQWRESFAAFQRDMGERPKGYLLDRIDGDGNYEPGNCRWASPTLSARNRKGRMLLTAFGETKCVSEWTEDPRCKATAGCIEQRIRLLGWEHERSLTTPSARPSKRSPH